MEPSENKNSLPQSLNIPANASGPQSKVNFLLILAIVLLFAILAVGVFIAWQLMQGQNSQGKKNNNAVRDNSKDGNSTPKNYDPLKQLIGQKKIAYLKENVIWVVNSDGSNKTELVSSQDISNFSIVGLAWKDKDSLSYIRCIRDCQIFTQNVEKNIEESLDVAPGEFAGETQIFALAWNHAGNQLAYIYRLPDGQMRMDFKSGSIKNIVKTFASLTAGQGGRGGSLDDNVSIYFSPDDKYVLVTNTLGQPTVNDKSTIWVFDVSGKELANIESDVSSWATQARWFSSASPTITFKINDILYKKTIDSSQKPEIIRTIKPNFYNPVPIKSDTYYWTSTSSIPYLGLVQDRGNNPIVKFLDGFYKPEVLDDYHIITLKAQKVPDEQESIFSYISAGLSKVDLRDKKITDIDSGEINLFAISQ